MDHLILVSGRGLQGLVCPIQVGDQIILIGSIAVAVKVQRRRTSETRRGSGGEEGSPGGPQTSGGERTY